MLPQPSFSEADNHFRCHFCNYLSFPPPACWIPPPPPPPPPPLSYLPPLPPHPPRFYLPPPWLPCQYNPFHYARPPPLLPTPSIPSRFPPYPYHFLTGLAEGTSRQFTKPPVRPIISSRPHVCSPPLFALPPSIFTAQEQEQGQEQQAQPTDEQAQSTQEQGQLQEPVFEKSKSSNEEKHTNTSSKRPNKKTHTERTLTRLLLVRVACNLVRRIGLLLYVDEGDEDGRLLCKTILNAHRKIVRMTGRASIRRVTYKGRCVNTNSLQKFYDALSPIIAILMSKPALYKMIGAVSHNACAEASQLSINLDYKKTVRDFLFSVLGIATFSTDKKLSLFELQNKCLRLLQTIGACHDDCNDDTEELIEILRVVTTA